MILSEERFLLARSRLSLIVQEAAAQLRDDYGFGFTAVDTAPSTLQELSHQWQRCRVYKEPFPVWAGASDNTIYLRPEDNHAFRFWHDHLHVTRGLGMSLSDELAVSVLHVQYVDLAYGKGSIEAALMAADTAGQALYYMVHGEHVPNQLQFARAHFGLGVS